jgi:DNA-binding NtrC family response regulator
MTDARKALLVLIREHRDAVLRSLDPKSWEVHLASDCRQARDLLRQEEFDLVVTDVSLPDGNWLTISRESNQEDAPPALVVCLPRQAERLAAILGAGQVQVLMPPLESETIHAVLKQALQSRQAPLQRFADEPAVRAGSHYAPLPV